MLKKSKPLENYHVTKETVLETKTFFNKFHETNLLKSTFITKFDSNDYSPLTYNTILIDKKTNLTFSYIKKGEEIADLINYSMKKPFFKSIKTFKKALRHYCICDIISQDENNVTVVFLPLTTSNNKVSCGIQKFDTILVHSNNSTNFYITRLLFHKTMTKNDYFEWTNKDHQLKGDINVRKIIFDNIQKDLDQNYYSVLKDTDLEVDVFNSLFFNKELPLVKFKFTDLIIDNENK